MNFKIGSLLLIALCGLACQSTPTPVKAMDEAIASSQNSAPKPLTRLPSAVRNALLPNQTTAPQENLLQQARYDVLAENVAVREFFAGLMQPTPYSVVVHPEVRGSINLDLKQVTLPAVLELVMEVYNFDVRKRGNIFTVYPSGIRTETIAVNYLMMQRDGFTQTSITSGGITQSGGGGNRGGGGGNYGGGNSNQGGQQGTSADSAGSGGMGGMGGGNGTNISTRAQTDFWTTLEETLKTMIGTSNGRSVIVAPQAGLVTVRAMPDEIRAIKRYLRTSEENIQRQVVLEARIIEVALDDEYQQGINWSNVLANGGRNTQFTLTNTAGNLGNSISGRLGAITSLNFVNADFSGVLSLLSTQGNVQVLSSPRVTAMNNQKAVIKVGNDEYFVTDVSSQSTITANATSTGPDIELTPFFSGIALDVTPQINALGDVLLHVHPSVIETEEQEKTVTLNQEQFVLPLAQSNIRESDTMIRAKSGEIVVIGGLMQSVSTETESGLPLLRSIPGVGQLFKSSRTVESKKELVILIKPTVVERGTWQNQLQRSRDYMGDWLEE